MALVESFSGIRGIFGKDLDEDACVRYAYSFLTLLRKKTGKNSPVVVIARDTRPSGQRIMDAVIGILDCDFINVGIVSTPCSEFAVRHFNADGGIMLTASHNEPEWNGFKFLGSDGAVLKPDEMQHVISAKNYLKNFHKIQLRKVLDKNREAIDEYSRFVLEIIGKAALEKIRDSKQKMLIDPNGGAGITAKHVLEKAMIDFAGVNMTPGSFKRKIEPTEESLAPLKSEISRNKCDFAVAFDCDADRAEIMLSDGRVISGNEIIAIAVDYFLAKTKKKNPVVVNDATSGAVGEICKKHGVSLVETEVGETNVVSEMEKRKSIIGGEGSSGGVIIAPSKCRDGILSMLTVLAACAESGKKIEDAGALLPKYHNLKTKIPFDAKNHDNIKKKLKSHYSKYQIKETGGIKGGLKVIIGDSFVWFRASKTEGDVFRIIADSPSKDEAERLLKDAVKVFENANR